MLAGYAARPVAQVNPVCSRRRVMRHARAAIPFNRRRRARVSRTRGQGRLVGVFGRRVAADRLDDRLSGEIGGGVCPIRHPTLAHPTGPARASNRTGRRSAGLRQRSSRAEAGRMGLTRIDGQGDRQTGSGPQGSRPHPSWGRTCRRGPSRRGPAVQAALQPSRTTTIVPTILVLQHARTRSIEVESAQWIAVERRQSFIYVRLGNGISAVHSHRSGEQFIAEGVIQIIFSSQVVIYRSMKRYGKRYKSVSDCLLLCSGVDEHGQASYHHADRRSGRR
jgi:hypothetical protein